MVMASEILAEAMINPLDKPGWNPKSWGVRSEVLESFADRKSEPSAENGNKTEWCQQN